MSDDSDRARVSLAIVVLEYAQCCYGRSELDGTKELIVAKQSALQRRSGSGVFEQPIQHHLSIMTIISSEYS